MRGVIAVGVCLAAPTPTIAHKRHDVDLQEGKKGPSSGRYTKVSIAGRHSVGVMSLSFEVYSNLTAQQ
jgi:hypothetical protein